MGTIEGKDALDHHDLALSDEDKASQGRWDEIEVSEVNAKALQWKLDIRIVPIVSLLYLLSFLDRGAIGNAKLYNLTQDLGLTDQEYLYCLMVFFFFYFAFEIPANILLKKFRPSIWFPSIVLAWGVVMMCQGFTTSFTGLFICRIFLGITECGLFPGVTYYLSAWYRKRQYGKRVAIFFSMATLSGAFAGLLTYGIHFMDGVGGKPGWAWVFIVLGLVTIVCAAPAFWLVIDFPSDPTCAKFLTLAERAFIIQNLQNDQQFSAAGEKISIANASSVPTVFSVFRDWKAYGVTCISIGTNGGLYGLSLFIPSILASLGYTANRANLLSIPIYAVACLFTVLVGFVADHTNKRLLFQFMLLPLAMIGYIIQMTVGTPGVKYFAVYFMACGVYAAIANMYSIAAANFEGNIRRGVVMAMLTQFGALQGAVSSNVYRAQDLPHYYLGHGVMLGYLAFGFLSSVAMWYGLRAENARRARGERAEVIGGPRPSDEDLRGTGGWFPTVEDAKKAKGDGWSGFRYTI